MMAPPTASMSTAGIDGHRCGASRGYSSKQHDVSRYDQWEMREEDIDDDGVGYDDDDDDEDDEEDEPMDILYEQEVFDEGHHRRRGGSHPPSGLRVPPRQRCDPRLWPWDGDPRSSGEGLGRARRSTLVVN